MYVCMMHLKQVDSLYFYDFAGIMKNIFHIVQLLKIRLAENSGCNTQTHWSQSVPGITFS